MDSFTRQLYERFPYPSIPWFALPSARTEANNINDTWQAQSKRTSKGIKILVIGCGTLEALAIARRYADAHSVTALDFSSNSLAQLKKRHFLAQFTLKKMAPLFFECADLLQFTPPTAYDFILASNILHHLENPAGALARIAGWLTENGYLRLTTYPKSSRIFMRAVGAFFRENHAQIGFTPKEAKKLIRTLSEKDPRRSCFESQPETSSVAGIADAFLHPCENPLPPLHWQQAIEQAGLCLVSEQHTLSSRSDFLMELHPKTAELTLWQRLQILDDLLELCANPIFWLCRQKTPRSVSPFEQLPKDPDFKNTDEELRFYLLRAKTILQTCGVTLDEMIEQLKTQVGPRVSAPPHQRILPGLSILDHWSSALFKNVL